VVAEHQLNSMEDTIFGKCPICGGSGKDYPAADLSSADAQDDIDGAGSSLRSASKGIVLVWYLGKLMCEMCKNRLKADEASRLSAEKHKEAQVFRDKVGFKREVE